MQIIKDFG